MIWFFAPAIIVLIAIMLIFNKLKVAENYVKDGYANIEVFLRKRYDLIPMVIDTAKAYAISEEQVLTNITNIRTQGDLDGSIQNQAEVDHRLAPLMKQIILNFEQYPNLKSDTAFLNVQTELIDVEDSLERARRYYNGCVRDYNNTIQKFPNNFVAQIFRAREKDFFEHSTT